MDNVFYKSKWIWLASGECDDQYVDFFDSFRTSGGRVTLYVSADSNYHVSVNGQSTYSGQYCDFERYKYSEDHGVPYRYRHIEIQKSCGGSDLFCH